MTVANLGDTITIVLLAIISLCIITGIIIVHLFPKSSWITLVLGCPLIYFLSWFAWLYVWYRQIFPVNSMLAKLHINPTEMGLTRLLMLGPPLLPVAIFIGSLVLTNRLGRVVKQHF